MQNTWEFGEAKRSEVVWKYLKIFKEKIKPFENLQKVVAKSSHLYKDAA